MATFVMLTSAAIVAMSGVSIRWNASTMRELGDEHTASRMAITAKAFFVLAVLMAVAGLLLTI